MKESGDYARFVWTWNGKPYVLPVTAKDVLTWARAIDAEGYPEAGVAWALLQRAAWLRVQGKAVSLGSLVEQYAQPINPAWFPGGNKHQAEVARLERIGDMAGLDAEIARAQKRESLAAKSWEALKPNTKKVVLEILAGAKQSPVKGAVHYWASRGPDFISNQARKPELILLDRGYGFGPGRNVFFAEKGSQQFGGIMPEGAAISSMVNIAPLAVMALLGVVTWKWLS